MSDPQMLVPWHRARASANRWWWAYLAVAAAGGALFVQSLGGRDPTRLAVFAVVPLLALRQAWSAAARVARIDRHLAGLAAYTPPSFHGENMSQPTETATFAAGCFWGVEEMFRRVPGVVSTRVGYTSGRTENPTYKQVCTDGTGHAEAVEIVYDPSMASFQQLLELFFENHDPTTLNRQGPDVGTQYRSGVYFHSPEQEKQAEAEIAKRQASGEYVSEITTEVVQATTFYPAEEYHQKYFMLRGMHHSCHFGNGKRARATAGAR